MDINTNPIEVDSAYVRRIENEEGFLKKYGSNLDNYLSEYEESEVESPTYIEIPSDSGEIFVRIPENIFTFQDEEAKQAYIDAVDAFLNSTQGYFEFSKEYANVFSFPIPTSPRYNAEYLYGLLNNDLRPNADPVVPYVHKPIPMDTELEPEEYFDLEVASDEPGVFNKFRCKVINLVNGMQICFLDGSESDEPSFIDGIEPHTMATVLLALYIINQEYPTVTPKLIERFIELGDLFNSEEEIMAFIDSYLKETQPARPVRKYPFQDT